MIITIFLAVAIKFIFCNSLIVECMNVWSTRKWYIVWRQGYINISITFSILPHALGAICRAYICYSKQLLIISLPLIMHVNLYLICTRNHATLFKTICHINNDVTNMIKLNYLNSDMLYLFKVLCYFNGSVCKYEIWVCIIFNNKCAENE